LEGHLSDSAAAEVYSLPQLPQFDFVGPYNQNKSRLLFYVDLEKVRQ
jgi:hypothetical protein